MFTPNGRKLNFIILVAAALPPLVAILTLFMTSQWPPSTIFFLESVPVVLLLVWAVFLFREEAVRLDVSEKRLIENDRWLKLALNAGNAATWTWTPDSGRVLWSDEHYRLYGLTPTDSQLSFEDWMETIYPDDRIRVREELRRAVAAKGEANLEVRIIPPDRNVRWVYLRGQVLCQDGNPLVKVTGISADITPLKKNEETLRESETRFRQLVDRIEDVFWILDSKTRKYLYVSEVSERLWGLSLEDFYADSEAWISRIHPDDLEMVTRNFIEKSSTTGIDQEFRVVLGDGGIKWARDRSFPIINKQGETERIVGITEDITARKEIERERESLLVAEQEARHRSELAETRFRILTEAIPIIVWTLTADGRLSYQNLQWAEYTGLTPEDSLDWGWQKAVHREDLPETLSKWNQAVTTGERFEAEFRLRHRDNIFRWFLARGVPITDASGGVSLWIWTCTDIHEHKRNQEIRAQLLELERQARDEAEAANHSKDEFVALVSHELRSPLNAMLGWARVLHSDRADTATISKAIRIIEQSANGQLRLIEDLLDTARIITGKLRLELTPVDLVAVTEAALEIMRPSTEAKEIELVFTQDGPIPLFPGDTERLHQVVGNLVLNAIKFTPAKGRIAVTLQNDEQGIRLSVSDTGRGISAEALPMIFTRFNQGNVSGTQRTTGLGLGLSLVRHIVELHGGTIRAESEGEGKGTTFIIDLPLPEKRRFDRLEPGSVSRSGLPTPSDPFDRAGGEGSSRAILRFGPTLAGLSVLVVDDEAAVRDLVSTVLQNYGATLTEASSAAEAMTLLTADPSVRFDAIVCDIGMPDEDGYSFIRRVRELPEDRGGRIPAVALTAFGRTTDRIKALEAGFQMHLSKPVEPAELMVVIAGLCGRQLDRPPYPENG